MPAPTRLFVGNLPFGVSEGELSEEFGCYGAVQSVELKHKKVTDGESNSQFAFITIESDIQNINKCIQEFSQQQWKGSFLNVTVARESFMEKLKREREEEGRKKQNQTLTPPAVPKDKSSEESTRNPVPLPAFKFVPKPVPVNNYINGDSKFVSKPAPVNNYTNGDNFENSKNQFDNDDYKFKSKSKYQPEFDEEYEQYPKSKHVSEYNENDDYQLSKNENGSEFNNDFAHPKHNYSQELKEPFQRKFSEVQRDYSIKKKGKVESMAPYVKQKIKIAPIVPLLAPAKPAEVKKLTAADEKRLQSIQNMKAAYNDKKSAIKIALSSVDKKVKKIIFDEDGAQIIPKETLTKDANKTNANLPGKKANKRKQRDGALDYNASADVGSKRNKKALFDETGSADEDDGINFDIKEQFQGESGQKLMQLQARFQSDKRFTMDERFMEERAEEGAEEGAGGEERVDAVEDEERLRQMDILQGILGRTVRTSGKFPTKEGDVNKKQVLLKTMLRFDPNRPDHSQFMSAPAGDLPAKKSKKQRKKEREEALSGQAEEKAAPQVSQERYYKVNESLKQSLDEQKPFSLLSLFGNREPQDDTSPAEYSAISIKKSTDKYQNPLTESNPFVYDSSDNEETTKKETREQVEESPYGIATPKALLVTENFFFSSTDPRFKEGVDFFMNIKPRSDKTREELKFLVKRRIQNNMRNERSHFKKVQQRHPAKTTKFRKR